MRNWIAILMLGCAVVTAPVTMTGCKTPPQVTAYNSMRGVAVTVDNAMRAYADLVVSGQVSDGDQARVKRAYEAYQRSMVVAITAARLDYSSPAPEDLKLIASELIDMIGGLL
jgi:hypothetical protein